jgi:Universal stress protein family
LLLVMALTEPGTSRFQHHVSFDNFAGGEPTERNTISFTLNVKHKGYTYKRRSRTFMVGVDENAYSDYALQWMLEELVDDGDEIVCLRVVDKDAKISSDKSLGRKEYQDEAKQLMNAIQAKNDDNRAISIVLEFAVGKVHTTFQKMVSLLRAEHFDISLRHAVAFSTLLTKLTNRSNSTNPQCSL